MLDIRDFSAVYGAQGSAPEAVVEIRAKLMFNSNGEVIAARSFRHATPATSENVVAVVDAFEKSLQLITDDVAAWTLESGNVHAAKS